MIEDIFPTALGIYSIDVDLAQLENDLQTIDVFEHSLVTQGYSSWKNANVLDHKRFASLRSEIEECLQDYCNQTGLPKLNISISWHNYMSAGSKVQRHRHEFSSISGAFYVKATEGSCPLKLYNPLYPYMMTMPKEKEGKYSSNVLSIDAIPGRLILFPSWLEHETTENSSNETRTVISFNTFPKNILV